MRQVWSTDGTTVNTNRLTDLNANGLYGGIVGDTNGKDGRMIVGPGGLYMVADDGYTGKELYFMQLTQGYVPSDPPARVAEPTKSGAFSFLWLVALLML